MKRPLLAVGAIATAALAGACLFAHQAVNRQRERNLQLQAQVKELTQRESAESPPGPLAMPAKVTSSLPGEQWRQLLRLRGEYGVLRNQLLEASRLRADNSRLHSNWVQQLAGGKKLTQAQVAPYLANSQRSAESLIVASRLTGDLDLLREAVDRYPQDPLARFAACFALKEEPGDQRERLEAFKQSDPDNALASYLSAQEHFRQGQKANAVRDLAAAGDKPLFQDYYLESVRNAQEAYEAAGLSSLEAAELAGGVVLLPQLAELRGLGQNLAELAQSYRQSGDEESAMAALQLGVALGRQLVEPSGQSLMIGELVGIAIEKQLLETLDPGSAYDAAGSTVRDRLDALAKERDARKQLSKQVEPRLRSLSDADRAAYYERMRAAGEVEAWRWLASQPP